ncbi:hypothetical protein PR003_g3262 [Phytophthora rubi]|uniref:Uncharacterized protein n=1 Tax=Phytophthora rubi TaxID=129364 RepID=A0A6A4G1F9_9STRA|nr:hypothetical protein PR002_g3595 [Phytophthora rubi]KAE9049258.1 hypothetical protein PR001_g3481 [Phytophthora rubi]KAE9354624.1 hypothetical protein PR003_g3262 [Phytophthora rubi]
MHLHIDTGGWVALVMSPGSFALASGTTCTSCDNLCTHGGVGNSTMARPLSTL